MTKAERLIHEAEGPQGLGFKEPNRVRFYNVVRPKKDGEAIVEMYAVRNKYEGARRKLPEVEIFRTCLWDTGSPTMRFWGIGPRNDYYSMAGYTVCFPEDDWKPSEYTLPYKFGGPMLIRYVRYLNGFDGTKYARAGYKPMSGLHILEFAELYRISPKVEHLAKAGLWWLLTPRFVSRLSSDGAYFRFFRSNVAEIMRTCPGLAIINHAFAHGVCLAEAAKWYEAARLCRDVPANLRKGENPLKIVAYVEKAGTSFGQYGRYLELLSLNGRHLDEFGVRYPRDFHAAFNAEDEANGRRTRRENHRRDAARNRSIASLAADLAAISDREFGAMRVHFPVSEADLRREGNIMHNCIGGYGGRIASRSSICFFIRTADGGPVADVEMRDNKVVQCYAPMNCKPEQPVIELADTVAGLIKSRLKEVGQERNGKTAIKE